MRLIVIVHVLLALAFIVFQVTTLAMILVERGDFFMGDTWSNGYDNEKPIFGVRFTYDFYIGKHPVTFDEYDRFIFDVGWRTPDCNAWGRGRRPVIDVSWWDAIAYCNWISENEGLPRAYDDKGNFLDSDGNTTSDPAMVVGYRLPTEAEWEFAARGGNNSNNNRYSGANAVGFVAWYYPNSGGTTHEVGSKAPNELGLYDMSGNVWEWCSDWYLAYTSTAKTNPYTDEIGAGRIIRGGSHYDSAPNVRIARRHSADDTRTNPDIGFRIVRTAQ